MQPVALTSTSHRRVYLAVLMAALRSFTTVNNHGSQLRRSIIASVNKPQGKLGGSHGATLCSAARLLPHRHTSTDASR
jgi:hypothetical protein